MLSKQLELIDEQTSPLFRLMWISNPAEPFRRTFDNNICAFHIGGGYILSVAHNLRTDPTIFRSIDQALYTAEMLPFFNQQQVQLFENYYPLDLLTNKRYLNIIDPVEIQNIVTLLKQINFDTRWLTLSQKNICNPYLIVQFKNNQFYNDPGLTAHFNHSNYFHEPALSRHTYLLETELVEAFYSEDIALYKLKNIHPDIINRLPSIKPDFTIKPDNQTDYYCLQSSPGNELGRLLNKAQIEGYLDNYENFIDNIGGNYIFEGLRYLIKGYFRFGSSGAPYIYYDEEQFKVNAIQSQACPIQLSIHGNMDGNFQYVNAIASPLSIIEEKLKAHIAGA